MKARAQPDAALTDAQRSKLRSLIDAAEERDAWDSPEMAALIANFNETIRGLATWWLRAHVDHHALSRWELRNDYTVPATEDDEDREDRKRFIAGARKLARLVSVGLPPAVDCPCRGCLQRRAGHRRPLRCDRDPIFDEEDGDE